MENNVYAAREVVDDDMMLGEKKEKQAYDLKKAHPSILLHLFLGRPISILLRLSRFIINIHHIIITILRLRLGGGRFWWFA